MSANSLRLRTGNFPAGTGIRIITSGTSDRGIANHYPSNRQRGLCRVWKRMGTSRDPSAGLRRAHGVLLRARTPMLLASLEHEVLDRALAASAIRRSPEPAIDLGHAARRLRGGGGVADLTVADDIARTHDHVRRPCCCVVCRHIRGSCRPRLPRMTYHSTIRVGRRSTGRATLWKFGDVAITALWTSAKCSLVPLPLMRTV
jgi:hypothetical protein